MDIDEFIERRIRVDLCENCIYNDDDFCDDKECSQGVKAWLLSEEEHV